MIYCLDLSIASSGVVVADEDYNIKEVKTIKTNSSKNTPYRLNYIREELKELTKKYPPKVIIIERGFTRYNKATQQLYRVHGVVNQLFWKEKQIYYSPSEVKKIITGKGNSNKKEVAKKVKEFFPDINFKNNDESDALALLYTYKTLNNEDPLN